MQHMLRQLLTMGLVCFSAASGLMSPVKAPHGSYCGSYQDIVKKLRIDVGTLKPGSVSSKVNLTAHVAVAGGAGVPVC